MLSNKMSAKCNYGYGSEDTLFFKDLSQSDEAEISQNQFKQLEKELETLLILEQETNKIIETQSSNLNHLEDAIQQIKFNTIESEKEIVEAQVQHQSYTKKSMIIGSVVGGVVASFVAIPIITGMVVGAASGWMYR